MKPRLGKHPREYVETRADLAAIALAIFPTEPASGDLLAHVHSMVKGPSTHNPRAAGGGSNVQLSGATGFVDVIRIATKIDQSRLRRGSRELPGRIACQDASVELV
jgi:hypothetical protein